MEIMGNDVYCLKMTSAHLVLPTSVVLSFRECKLILQKNEIPKTLKKIIDERGNQTGERGRGPLKRENKREEVRGPDGFMEGGLGVTFTF